jgi:hypothetical protein
MGGATWWDASRFLRGASSVERLLDRWTGVQTSTPEVHFLLGVVAGFAVCFVLCCTVAGLLLYSGIGQGFAQHGGAQPYGVTVHQSVNTEQPRGLRPSADTFGSAFEPDITDLRHDSSSRGAVSLRGLRRGGGTLA